MKSKEYIKGFKHGVKWAKLWILPSLKLKKELEDEELTRMREEFDNAVKEAVKSLKKGR